MKEGSLLKFLRKSMNFSWRMILNLLYRKFLKQPEIVYNGQKIKNDMTKERRGLRHDVVMKFFVLV